MITTIAVTSAAVAWLSFLAWYSVRAKWWKSPIGRNTFGVSFVLFIILFRIAMLRWFPNLRQHDWAGTILYVLAFCYGVQRIVFVERAQREAHAMKMLGLNRRSTDI